MDGAAVDETVTKNVQIYGPGDVVGIDKKNIIRTEPRHYITNFEPNYVAFIDFYDEDLPWRYSPDQPQNHRLQPWMALIVLTDEEFNEAPAGPDQPLPAIDIQKIEALPPTNELYAWAHVQLNESILGDSTFRSTQSGLGTKVEQLLDGDPDLGFSRVLCPRRLAPDTAYHAFLVPTFESGRLAGLGQDIAQANPAVMDAAWGNGQTILPIYHRWYFRTGGEGDFESLVRLLKPRPVPAEVGRNPIDVSDPGANVTGISDPELGDVLLLGGALRVPDKSLEPEELELLNRYRNWDSDYPHPFQEDLANFINLTDAYAEKSAEDAHADASLDTPPASTETNTYSINGNPDPVITAPLYARWHALTQRLLTDRAGNGVDGHRNWVHQLNLDPRHRTAAGYGTQIIQKGQEDYMEASWQQVGEIIEANRRIVLAQMAREVGRTYYVKYLTPGLEVSFPRGQAYANQRDLSLTAPVLGRIRTSAGGSVAANAGSGEVTLRYQLESSQLAPVALSPQMRKVTRPRAAIANKRLDFENAPAEITPGSLIDRMAAGEVTAAPPREAPTGAPSHRDIADQAEPDAIPTDWKATLREWLIKIPWLKYVPLIAIGVMWLLALFLGWFIGLAIGTLITATVFLIGLYFWLLQLIKNPPPEATDPLDPVATPSSSVGRYPKFPDFRISEPGENFTPTEGNTDSAEGAAYKEGLKDQLDLIKDNAESAPPRTYIPIDLGRARAEVVRQLNPEVRVPERVGGTYLIPEKLRIEQFTERFVPAMAYPRIDTPMYEPLVDENPNWFLPNIDRIPQDTISLLETNQPFIEAYMVGLNHEMGRELLWREFPTDQRGSYFRKFWESVDLDPKPDATEEERREANYDIPKLHRWSKFNKLGDHDLREMRRKEENPNAAPREEAVLVIRGELLKKYPNAIIYAQKAKWDTKTVNGQIVPDNLKPRRLAEEGDLGLEAEERDYRRTPIYEAQVKPDIYFFGFDLTVEEARGDKGDSADDDAGWFFVIQEQPGEPRLGLDLAEGTEEVEVWNDLSWQHLAVDSGQILTLSGRPAITLNALETDGTDNEKEEQRVEDNAIAWNANMNAADLAYVLYQVPVLVAVHAADMVKAQPKD